MEGHAGASRLTPTGSTVGESLNSADLRCFSPRSGPAGGWHLGPSRLTPFRRTKLVAQPSDSSFGHRRTVDTDRTYSHILTRVVRPESIECPKSERTAVLRTQPIRQPAAGR
jgi:hypothetical protein